MTRVPIHSVASAPEASRDALKALEATFGKVLNIHGAMAHSPVALDAGWTDAQLAESTVLVSLNVLTNFFFHAVQVELDLLPAPEL